MLRDDWGFEGLVVSDWGAVEDRVAALIAGLDLQMPGGSPDPDAELVAAVESGALAPAVLERAAGRVVDLVAKAQARPAVPGPLDVESHHALAREAAGRSIVLLTNDAVEEGAAPLLPLAADASIAVIGEFARTPRFQGSWSCWTRCWPSTRVSSSCCRTGPSWRCRSRTGCRRSSRPGC
ncbi:glycoside hydrolase family 3 N-terminal domain-containing protein [Tessaracoccus defluvii]|uniref:glycoside hydrolase family 3 N-terminal domain-containing protein n=1 Tax=Tessaracoccus defluvii TaxID=1285901 RepID=UPI0021F6C756|nr:glycoside hydrolase family 3 N-terminal domain-containing protein [Tessaracoccus defluvii]